MKFVAGNAQNIGARPQQQDAFGFSDPGDPRFVAHAGFLGVVADGMGGLTHGSEASRSAVLAFLSAYKRKTIGESIPKALTRCLGEANLGVLRVAQNVPAGDEVGTTLVAAVLHHHTLYWISVGDSRIYLLRGATLTQLTADHVFARDLNHQVAEGKISLREALGHPERSSLTSYLGQVEPAHVDKNIRPLQVKLEDCVMLCSDGFYRALTEQELVTGLRNNSQTACETLVGQALAKHRKQQDNLTVITLKRYTRAHLSRKIKRVLAVAAMVLIVMSGASGYWIGRRFATATTPPPAPSPAAPNQSAAGDGGQKAQATQPSPKSKPSKTATAGPSKKNDTGKNGGKQTNTPLTDQPTDEETIQPEQAKPSQALPTEKKETEKTSDKSDVVQTGPQNQQNQDEKNKTAPTRAPGSTPSAPTPSDTTSVQPNDPNKNDSKEPTSNPSPIPPKDNPKNPPPPPKPNTSQVEDHMQSEG